MSANSPDFGKLNTETNARFSRNEIVETIQSLPEPLSGYCSWILAGSCDIAKTLLNGQDVTKSVPQLDHFAKDAAEQTAVSITAAAELTDAAAAFENKFVIADVVEEFSEYLAEEIGFDEEVSLGLVLSDLEDCLFALIDDGTAEDSEQNFLSAVSKLDLSEDDREKFVSVFEALQNVVGHCQANDIPEEKYCAVPDDILESLIKKLPTKQRALCAYIHNGLLSVIRSHVGDRIEMAQELLEKNLKDSEAVDAFTEQICYSSGLSARITASAERFAPKGEREPSELAQPLVETFANHSLEYAPLIQGLKTLYQAACAIQGNTESVLSDSLVQDKKLKTEAVAAELAEACLGKFDPELEAQFDEFIDDAKDDWKYLRKLLSLTEIHIVGQALGCGLYPLSQLNKEQPLFRKFLEVSDCETVEMFENAVPALVTLMGLAAAYSEKDSPVPDFLQTFFYPQSEVEIRNYKETIETLGNRFTSVIEDLPGDKKVSIALGFSAAGFLAQGVLELPDDMRNSLYECKKNDAELLTMMDVQMATLFRLGVAASEYLKKHQPE